MDVLLQAKKIGYKNVYIPKELRDKIIVEIGDNVVIKHIRKLKKG